MLSHEQCDGIVAVGHDAVLCDALTPELRGFASRRSRSKSPGSNDLVMPHLLLGVTERFLCALTTFAVCWSKSRPPGRPCPGMTTSASGVVFFEPLNGGGPFSQIGIGPRSRRRLTTHERHKPTYSMFADGRIQPDCRSNAQHQDRRAYLTEAYCVPAR